MIYEAETVRRAIEAESGVSLEREGDPPPYLAAIFATPAGRRAFPRVEAYSSPKEWNERFDGEFALRIWQEPPYGDTLPDRGVIAEPLKRFPSEVRPDHYTVSATAERANVELMFWSNTTAAITPEAEATWAMLKSWLASL